MDKLVNSIEFSVFEREESVLLYTKYQFGPKILFLFHQKTTLCCSSIFLHVEIIEISEITAFKSNSGAMRFSPKFLFKICLKRETNLMQSCSANQLK